MATQHAPAMPAVELLVPALTGPGATGSDMCASPSPSGAMADGADPPADLRLLIVDDHDVVHWGFRLMLSRVPWVERCLFARTGKEALAVAERHAPHIALVDLFVGCESGPEICEQLHLVHDGIRVLLMSGSGRISVEAARACGATGFIPKEWSAAAIARAVRMASLGLLTFESDPSAEGGDAVPALTSREHEVLAHLATGATNQEIARELHLSPHTVKEHLTRLYRKLEARNRADAVMRAQRRGLLR